MRRSLNFSEPWQDNISSVGRSAILLEPPFLLIKVLTLPELSPGGLMHRNTMLYCHYHSVILIIFKVKWSNGAVFPDGDPCSAIFLMQRASNDSVWVLVSPKDAILRVHTTNQENVDFIQKPDILKKFLVVVDLSRKSLTHSYAFYHISLAQLVLGLDPMGIKFERFNQKALNRRYRFQVLRCFVAKILTDSVRLTFKPKWDSWVFRFLSEAKIGRKPLSDDIHTCYELQKSGLTWKYDSCLGIFWNWSEFG